MKKIVISKCADCPYVSHRGAFGAVSYIPTCTSSSGRIIPHTKHVSRNNVVARAIDVIPDWCPLEDNNEVLEADIPII